MVPELVVRHSAEMPCGTDTTTGSTTGERAGQNGRAGASTHLAQLRGEGFQPHTKRRGSLCASGRRLYLALQVLG
jgi:hypothetical protein